jgi:hypothetical protein
MGLDQGSGTVSSCGVIWAGVTDLNLLYEGHWSCDSDMTDVYKSMVSASDRGRPGKADAAKFAADLPAGKQAARLKQPLIAGLWQRRHARAAVHHGTRVPRCRRSAATSKVEWIEYPKKKATAGSLPKNRFDFWSRSRKIKILVAQGGGPTAVINQSLVGVVLEARRFGD